MFGLRNRRKIKNTPVKALSRRWKPVMEILEERTVPTANLYVDFGDTLPAGGFNLTVNQLRGTFGAGGIQGPDLVAQGLTGTDNLRITTLSGAIFSDYNGDGTNNAQDYTDLKNAILQLTQRYYAAFDVNVTTAPALDTTTSTTYRNGIISTLQGGSNTPGERDCYVFCCVITDTTINQEVGAFLGLNGISRGIDIAGNNANDDSELVFANTVINGLTAAQMDTGLAHDVAHEAAHDFGLEHTSPTAGNNNLLTQTDVIRQGGSQGVALRNVNIFTRFPLPTVSGAPATVNNFDRLSDNNNLGPAANFAAYVTGTGANDHITITSAGAGSANVLVQAYSDTARTVLINSFNYVIATNNGILVEGATGDDLFEIDGALAATVTLRGMPGNSALLVQGAGLSGSFTPTATTTVGLDGNTYSSGSVVIGATNINIQEYVAASQIQINNSSAFTYLAGASADVLALNSTPGQVTGIGALPMVFTNTNTLIGANGGANNDQFNITPSAFVPFNVNGGGAAETNTATFDLAGVTNPVLTYTGPNSYTATFGNRATVTLVNIQGVNAINGTFAFVINGTNQNDVFRISRNGANVVVTLSTNGGAPVTVLDVPANTFNPINFNGLDGNDQLIVDESGGMVTNTLNFDGGNPVYPTTPGDSVFYTGGTITNLIYTASGIGAGTINADGNVLNFISTEPVTVVSALGTVTINLTDNAANHTITLGDDGTLGNNLSKVTIDGGIESLTFTNPTNTLAFAGNFNFSNVVILNALDTASLTPTINLVGGNVNDVFRITSLRNGQSVNVLANAGNDSTVVGGSSLATFNTGSAVANLANVLGTVNVLSNSTSTVYIDDSGFAGGRTITSDNIASMPTFSTQGVHTTVNGLTTAINVNNFAGGVQTASGAGNDTFRINTTQVSNYSNGTTETFFGNNGNDNFFVRPSTSAGIFVFGGAPAVGDPGVPPDGDRLVVFAYGATVNPLFSSDGVVNAPGFVGVTFNNIEFVSVPDRFEINDTPSQATFLGSNPFVSEPNLSIHAVDDPSTPLVNEADIDYFRYVAHDTGYITINAQYLSIVGGQMVVEVYRPTSLANLSGPNVIGAPFNNVANYITSTPGAVGTIDGTTLNIPVVKGQIYYIKVRGSNQQQDAGNYNLEIENFAAPVPTAVALPADLAGSALGTNDNDTGRSNSDKITKQKSPYFIVQADLRDFASAGITMLTAAQATTGLTAGAAVQVYVRTNNGTPITSLFANPIAGSNSTLWDVQFNNLQLDNVDITSYQITASVVMFDNNSPNGLANELKRTAAAQFGSPPLTIQIDTKLPAPPTLTLKPGDDSGIPGQAGTFNDNITKYAAANFTGTAEAKAWIQLTAFDRSASPVPAFGTAYSTAFGQYQIAPIYNLNDNTFFDLDGERSLSATATDIAGNESDPNALLIFLDTRGPQVAAVTYRYDVDGNPIVIDLLNQTLNGQKVALPAINYIDVTLVDQPVRTDNFLITDQNGGTDNGNLYAAANQVLALTPGNYAIIGKRTGNAQITSVAVLEDATASGTIGQTTYRLFLSKPLADDKYTFKVFDRIQDEAGNALDGDFQPPVLPSGDGVPGGNFVISFLTIDVRAELGFYANGSANLDLNGDFVVNPGSNVGDDAVMAYTPNGSAVFSGQFYDEANYPFDGFDKLGTYGKENGKYVFRRDLNNDGDFNDLNEKTVQTSLQINGLPISGNWGPGAVNPATGIRSGSNVGVFDGTTWYLDSNGDNIIQPNPIDTVLKSNMRGLPFTGDFDGDRNTDLGTYLNGTFYFSLTQGNLLPSGNTNYTFRVTSPLQLTGTASKLARPVAADFDGDGITDVGLFLPNQTTVPNGQANWYLFNSSTTGFALPWDVTVPSGSVRGFKNVVTGVTGANDIAATYGSAKALPVVGNFDPVKKAVTTTPAVNIKSQMQAMAPALADLYFGTTDSTDFVIAKARKGKAK